jgi:hypothetical protein
MMCMLRRLGGALKGIAKQALPLVGGALGSAVRNLCEVEIEGETQPHCSRGTCPSH